MFTEHSAFLHPSEGWFEVHQYNPDAEPEYAVAIDRHYLTPDCLNPMREARHALHRLRFTVPHGWQESWARPGELFAVLDRITEAAR